MLVAAEESHGKDGKARGGWLDCEASLVEVNHDQAVVLISGRASDYGDPFLEESIGGDEATGLTVFAGSVVSIVAEVWSNENEVGCGGLPEQILRQETEVDDVSAAIG